MDTRRSYFLAALKDELDRREMECLPDGGIPFVVPANDNKPAERRLSARCGAMLRRLILRRGFNSPP